jgi:DNA-binding response OmpR family regulator
MDGLALLRTVRADARMRDLPVLLLSGRSSEEARLEGLAQGADEYLVKPFSSRQLVATVRSHIALSMQRRAAIVG